MRQERVRQTKAERQRKSGPWYHDSNPLFWWILKSPNPAMNSPSLQWNSDSQFFCFFFILGKKTHLQNESWGIHQASHSPLLSFLSLMGKREIIVPAYFWSGRCRLRWDPRQMHFGMCDVKAVVTTSLFLGPCWPQPPECVNGLGLLMMDLPEIWVGNERRGRRELEVALWARGSSVSNGAVWMGPVPLS